MAKPLISRHPLSRDEANKLAGFYHALNRRLLVYAYIRLGNWDRAEETVQEVWVRACYYAPRKETWFYRCLNMQLVNQARGHHQIEWLECPFDLNQGSSERFEEGVLKRVMLEQLASRLKSIEQATVLELELQGWGYAEIGKMLQRTPNAIKSLHNRAINALAGRKRTSIAIPTI